MKYVLILAGASLPPKPQPAQGAVSTTYPHNTGRREGSPVLGVLRLECAGLSSVREPAQDHGRAALYH